MSILTTTLKGYLIGMIRAMGEAHSYLIKGLTDFKTSII